MEKKAKKAKKKDILKLPTYLIKFPIFQKKIKLKTAEIIYNKLIADSDINLPKNEEFIYKIRYACNDKKSVAP